MNENLPDNERRTYFGSLQTYVNRDTLEEIRHLDLGPDEQIQLVQSLLTPQQQYYLRVNLTKCSKEDLIQRWREKNVDVLDVPAFPETIGIRVASKPPPPLARSVVYAYKFAAESVLTGAHLYVPGVGPNSHVRAGVLVEIRDWERKIHVASGRTRMNLRNPPHQTGIAVENLYSPYKIWGFHESEEYKAGLVDDQSLPPVAVGHVVMSGYSKGLKILDICAAPGGKTTSIAQIGKLSTGDWPEIMAIDRSSSRLRHLEEKAARLGVSGIRSLRLKLEHVHVQHPEWKESYDLVLLDPPCSALGTRPKIYIDTPARYYHDFAANQFRLLQHAWELVKPGGILVYSTCTITKAENEDNVVRMLETFNAELVPIKLPHGIGHGALPHECLSKDDAKKLCRFWPHLDDCIGYFIAKFQRPS